MSTLSRILYRNMLISMNQSKVGGSPNKAKPLLILCIIDCIEEKSVVDNKILFDVIAKKYKDYLPEIKGTIARENYPFYFLTSDNFYHLQWKESPIKTKAPSAKFIRDHVEYAYLDNALWDLLQEPDVRQEYRELIINHYFKEY